MEAVGVTASVTIADAKTTMETTRVMVGTTITDAMTAMGPKTTTPTAGTSTLIATVGATTTAAALAVEVVARQVQIARTLHNASFLIIAPQTGAQARPCHPPKRLKFAGMMSMIGQGTAMVASMFANLLTFTSAPAILHRFAHY